MAGEKMYCWRGSENILSESDPGIFTHGHDYITISWTISLIDSQLIWYVREVGIRNQNHGEQDV